MLIAQDAVDGEAGLITDAEAAIAENVQRLRLGGQKHFPQTLVAHFSTSDFVDDDLRRVLLQTHQFNTVNILYHLHFCI